MAEENGNGRNGWRNLIIAALGSGLISGGSSVGVGYSVVDKLRTDMTAEIGKVAGIQQNRGERISRLEANVQTLAQSNLDIVARQVVENKTRIDGLQRELTAIYERLRRLEDRGRQ